MSDVRDLALADAALDYVLARERIQSLEADVANYIDVVVDLTLEVVRLQVAFKRELLARVRAEDTIRQLHDRRAA